jgi:hypothetical protein
MTNVEIIKKYCTTLDSDYLKELDQAHAVLFQKLCVYALTIDGTNKNIARSVLVYYEMDEKGKSKILKKKPLKKIEDQISNLTVGLTGSRSGDVLVGAAKRSKGAVLKIHKCNIPPQKSILDGVRYYPGLWEKFIVKLGSVPFFSSMSKESRDIWLQIHQVDNENSICHEGGFIEIIQPGVSDFVDKLTAQQVDIMIQGNPKSENGYWTSKDIEDMMPRKAGSQARRHTLILTRNTWKIAVDYEVTDHFDQLVLDVPNGKVINNSKSGEYKEIFVIGSITKKYKKVKSKKLTKWQRPNGNEGNQRIGIMVDKSRYNSNQIDIIINAVYPCNISRIKYSLRQFTCASYKSLLQKIIRFHPSHVNIGLGEIVDSKAVLVVCMGLLADHQGAFIPDIQRYVTGMESFTKRLAVTIYEDSYLPDGNTLFSLLAGSLLSQRVRNWKPDEDLLKVWLNAGITALEQNMAVKVDYHGEITKEPYVLKEGQNIFKNSSAILDELRSFPTDLGLARGWAREYPNWDIQRSKSNPVIMPLEHCVDQHWAPQVALYFDKEFVTQVCEGHTSGQPFKQLFCAIWDHSSSINPRRMNIDFTTFESKSELKNIRKAQTCFLISKQNKQKDRPETGGIYNLKYTLEDSWLSGLVGAIDVKTPKHPHMLVTLSGDDPLKLVVIRRPSRNMSSDPLSPESEEVAIKIAKYRLKKGIILNKATPPDSVLEKSRVYLVEDEDEEPYYSIKKDGKKSYVNWDVIKHLDIDLPIHSEYIPLSIESSLINVGVGVEEGADKKLVKLVAETDKNIVRRALVYISTFNPKIEINRISRDGSGTYRSVILEDVGAYQFLLSLSTLYPSAISPTKYGPGKFTVPVGPMLWTLKNRISIQIFGSISKKDFAGWDKIPFNDTNRSLWSHQQEIVDDMIKRHLLGSKGSFIWVPVGMGKTLSVLTYLKYLKDTHKLPKYVVYTLPQSAIKSIIQEIKYFNIPINLIIPLENIEIKKGLYKNENITVSKNCLPVPYTINLIEHDHIRRCEGTLTKQAPETFFIVDEVHKTLNDTKRTSVALEIAHLSRDFVVLTGTPVIDSNTYKLIGWLEQVVPYEVNSQNFWVAASSMIAKKVNTGVKIDFKEVSTSFTVKEEKRYKQLVPPALGGTNINPSYTEWKESSDICYDASDREIINLTNKLLKDGRGVMVVAKDTTHQNTLYDLVLKGTSLKSKDIFRLTGGDSIFLTDEYVNTGKVPDYKVVIVPIKKAEGYTLTRLSAMVTSVYPSNNATREQIEGRINRISQNEKMIIYRTVHIGVLTAILRNHNNAKNLSIALQGLAKEITI